MECKDCLFLFDDYIADELAAEERSKISEHLAACESCADFYETFRRQERAVEHYLLQAEASPALWGNLQTAIRNEKVDPLPAHTATTKGKLKSVFSNFNLIFSPHILAFSAFALIIACTLVFVLVRHKNYPAEHAQNNSERAPVSRINEPTNVNQSSTHDKGEKAISQDGQKIPLRETTGKQIVKTQIERSTRQAVPPVRKNSKRKHTEKAAHRNEQSGGDLLPGEEKYLEVIAGLTEEVKSIEPGLPPALSAEYKRSLSAVDKAIEETRKSARRHPKNQDVMNFVVAAYEGKIALLNEVAKQNQ